VGALQVVSRGVLDGGDPALANVDAEHRTAGHGTHPGEPGDGCGGTVVIEAHAVDDRAVGHEAKQTRLRVSGLGYSGQSSDLDVAEAELAEPEHGFAILVEASRNAER
jgi:hypothetical protein